ncbi:unnamed protein product [Paramecium primaurelia]|uniref:Ankyrin repeat protein n=2 Tax=Paramecium TaxID=5884 RepID=A0A8S1VLH1_9CILI|nr:unnamed protein product [Paramecium primaurelia]CAD8178848.1 unnamed protein product [Paramecium pentaurelia]
MTDQKQQVEQLKYALWLAIMQNKNEQIVQFFNSPKIEINVNVALTNQGITALHQAASNGNLNLVQFLVAIQKADIDQQDIFGRTPLHFACAIGNLAIVDYLIQSKASPNIQTIGGESPIMKAAQFHQSQLLFYLIQTHSDKINWNLVNKLGQNVLHIFRISCVNSLEKQNQIYTPINDVIVELMALIQTEGQQTIQ